MRLLALLGTVLLPTLAHAQVITEPARAVDGDTLDMTGQRIRLYGIDAPETEQTCERAGEVWACGKEASATLAALVSSGTIECVKREMDVYGRSVATCRAGYLDIGLAMVDAGSAVALPEAPPAYKDSEARRKVLKFGIWGSTFEQPAAYRAAHPREASGSLSEPTRAAGPANARPRDRSRPTGVYYRSCADARAAGAAPIHLGEPGYRPEMDGDGDGIACEPYRARR